MQTIGVLGGLGPQGTMDFEARLHRVAQGLVSQDENHGHPPLVVYYCRSGACAVDASGEREQPLRPHPDFLAAASGIGALADFLVVPCNFLHLFRPELEAAAGCEVLSMIDVTLAEVQARGCARVGVLGFGVPVVHTEPLQRLGLATETIEGALRDRLDAAIIALMEGRNDAPAARAAADAVEELRSRDVDAIVLGCTEIALLLGDAAEAADLVNPLQLLAEAAVARALA